MGSLNRHRSVDDAASDPGTEGGGPTMSPQRCPQKGIGITRRVFGVDNRVACSKCGQDTYLRRRSPHTALGDAYELQTFACRACKTSTSRVVDSEGRPFG
jgi:hypothetical protein